MATSKFYTGAALRGREAGKILKKVASSKVIAQGAPVEAMLGYLFLGSTNALLCTDTSLVYYNYNGGVKLDYSEYPLESVTSISTRATTLGREILLGLKGTTGVELKIVADVDNISLMVEHVRRRLSAHQTGGSALASPAAADEIKKYFGLKEQGIITQEEFEAKKKKLLG